MDKRRSLLAILLALGVLALIYNVFVKDAESFSGENTVRLLFVTVLVVGCAYELWKRAKRR